MRHSCRKACLNCIVWIRFSWAAEADELQAVCGVCERVHSYWACCTHLMYGCLSGDPAKRPCCLGVWRPLPNIRQRPCTHVSGVWAPVVCVCGCLLLCVFSAVFLTYCDDKCSSCRHVFLVGMMGGRNCLEYFI